MKKVLSFLIIVLVLALSISLVSCNNQNDPNAQKPNSDYEAQIEALQKIIEELQQGLISAEEAIKQLEDASANIKDWNDASVALSDKIAEINTVTEEFTKSVNVYDEKDENKENPLVTFYDLYEFSYTVGEKTVYHADQFAELQYNAIMNLYRATSVTEMNTIIANYKADIAKIPTILELYIANLEAVEKDGKVTYDEYETIVVAYQIASQITNDNIYTPAAEDEAKGQKEILAERLDTLITEFKPLVVEKFVELTNALPQVELLAPSHYEAVEAAVEEAAFVIELYGVDEAKKLETNKKGKLTAYGEALKTLAEVEAREVVVREIEAGAEALNEVLAEAFDKETLEAAGIKYGANIETYNYVYVTLNAHIKYWQTSNGIVTDEMDEDFNEELYNLINYSVYEGYIDMFEDEVATLRAAAEEFIAAVEAIENVNLDSKATLDAVKVLFDTVAKGQKIADVDTILSLNDYVDEDGELVEVTGVADSYKAWLNQYARYDWLVAAKKNLEESVKNALIVCTAEHKDADGKTIACDGKGACEKVGTYDLTKIGNFDADILEIIAMYELDETVYDAELLSVYKLARIQYTLEGVLNLVDAAHAASTNTKKDTLKAILVEEITAAAADYTFEAEYICIDPYNKNHKCDCAEDLSNWAMAIENEPAEVLAEKYTAEILADRFN